MSTSLKPNNHENFTCCTLFVALFCASSCDNIFFSLSYLQGKASGNKPALWLRSKIQTQLYQLGSNIQKNAGIFLFVGLLILAIFTFSLKNATLETRVEKLWVQGKPIFFFLTFSIDFLLLFLVFYAAEVRYLSSLKAWYDTFGL